MNIHRTPPVAAGHRAGEDIQAINSLLQGKMPGSPAKPSMAVVSNGIQEDRRRSNVFVMSVRSYDSMTGCAVSHDTCAFLGLSSIVKQNDEACAHA